MNDDWWEWVDQDDRYIQKQMEDERRQQDLIEQHDEFERQLAEARKNTRAVRFGMAQKLR